MRDVYNQFLCGLLKSLVKAQRTMGLMGWGWLWRDKHWTDTHPGSTDADDDVQMDEDGFYTSRGARMSLLPACWGGGGAGCRHTTSAPPPERDSASQTASPAPALRPAGRPYSRTAPFTRWGEGAGRDTGSSQGGAGQTNTGGRGEKRTGRRIQKTGLI